MKQDTYVCSDCGKESPVDAWRYVDYYFQCDICGEHQGRECPHCQYVMDPIFYEAD